MPWRSIHLLATRPRRAWGIRTPALLVCVIVLVGGAMFGQAVPPAAAQPRVTLQVTPPPTPAPMSCDAIHGACDPPLINGGGPVQSDPTIYLIFWGNSWTNDSSLSSTMQQLIQMFQISLAGGGYNNMLSQYGVHNDVLYKADWVDSQLPAANQAITLDGSTNSIQSEMSRALGMNTTWPLPVGNETTAQRFNNAQFMVFPQPGILMSDPGACGAHSWFAGTYNYYYSFVDTSGALSQCATDMNSVTGTATHEYAETATDPQVHDNGLSGNRAWTTKSGQEVGDLCNGNPNIAYAADVFYSSYNSELYVQSLWSNAAGSCMMSDGYEYASPASPGKHTVQGPIATQYFSLNADSGFMGEPVSEQEAIAGGQVSYFAGNGSCGGGVVVNGYTSGSAIYDSPATGAWQVGGCIYHRYTQPDLNGPNGGSAGKPGFPIGNVTQLSSNSWVSYFAGNSSCGGGVVVNGHHSGSAIYASPVGTYFVGGCIYNLYTEIGGPTGYVQAGYPISDVIQLSSNSWVSYFAGNACNGGGFQGSGTAIYSSPSGTYYVSGCIYNRYYQLGGPSKALGYPTSSVQPLTNPNGWFSTFAGTSCAHGSWQGSGSAIYAGAGTHEILGCLYQRYVQDLNGPGGFLGFPSSGQYAVSGGFYNTFAGTRCTAPGYSGSGSGLYWNSSAEHAYFVRGCLYQKYMSRQVGGPSGALGLPTSDEISLPSISAWESIFQGGCIYYYGVSQQFQIFNSLTDC